MILAIDTATQMVSLALHDGRRIRSEMSWESRNHHTVEVAPALQSLLDREALTVADLVAIALPTGPGSYTGLRIGMSLAKGMALAVEPMLPLIGIPTLAITAHVQSHHHDRLVAVSQAGRRRINFCHYCWGEAGWVPEGEAGSTTWEELLASLPRPAQIAGEIDTTGAELLAGAGDGLLISPAWANLRRAAVLADLAWRRFRAGDVDDTATLAPFYLS